MIIIMIIIIIIIIIITEAIQTEQTAHVAFILGLSGVGVTIGCTIIVVFGVLCKRRSTGI